MLLIGIGFVLCFPTLNIQATNGVADHEQGLASGLVQTSFQVGGAIGLAVVSAIVTAGPAPRPTPPCCSTPTGPRSSSWPASPWQGSRSPSPGSSRRANRHWPTAES